MKKCRSYRVLYIQNLQLNFPLKSVSKVHCQKARDIFKKVNI